MHEMFALLTKPYACCQGKLNLKSHNYIDEKGE